MDINAIKSQACSFINVINDIEIQNAAAIKSRQSLENTIAEIMKNNESNKEALDIATHAIEILRKVSDEAVSKAYTFLQESLNSALKKAFANTTRQIEIKESIRNGQYPQLELVLHVGNGKVRSLKSDSGHGLMEIVSLLSILSLIVITGGRRFLAIDEVLSGLSVRNRLIVTDILWSFTEIGFQFLVNDHGYVPEGSNVYYLEMVGDVSGVKRNYIAKTGVYLQSDGKADYDYSDEENSRLPRVSIDTDDNSMVEDINDGVNNISNMNEVTVINIETPIQNQVQPDGTSVLSI